MFSTTITDAFTRLEAAQDQLNSAVSAFHDVCTQVYRVATKPRSDDAYRSLLDLKLIQMHDQLGSLAETELKLRRSLAVLHRARNISATLVPINILPAEVLSKALGYAVSLNNCIQMAEGSHRLSPLVVIPSVCVSWRRLALATPQWWTHIDFSSSNSLPATSRVALWSQRANHVPLHLHFKRYQYSFENQEPNDILIRAGSFTFSETGEHCVQEVLNHYNSCGGSDVLKAITIQTPQWDGEILAHLTWSNYVPDTLTVLKLAHTFDRITPSLDELITLLSRTPNLRTLILRDVHIISGQSNNYPQISLPKLEYFESYPHRTTRPSYMGVTKHLMQCILPGPYDLEVWCEMGSPHDEEHDSAIQGFFARSRITRLHTGYFNTGDGSVLAQYLNHTPELRLLSLDFDGQPTDDVLGALTSSIEGEGFRARCPKLQTLRLSEAYVTLTSQDQLKQIVETHDITKLIMGDRVYLADESGQYDYDDTEIVEWLHERVDVDVNRISWFDLGA